MPYFDGKRTINVSFTLFAFCKFVLYNKIANTTMIKGLHEILTMKLLMMDAPFVRLYRDQIESNRKNHASFDDTNFVLAAIERRNKDGQFHISHLMYEDDEDWDGDMDADEEDDERYICVIKIEGPVTRNGGACSYGSKDHRNIILRNADNKHCIGFLIYLNTPGGAASAIADYKYAFEYARSKKLPVIAHIDGMAASAGMYIAALSDERYYMNPADKVGSIGVMAAWYSMKDGEKAETGETFHEVYSTHSIHKNEWKRAADEGDYKILIADLDKLESEFFADVKAACPKVKDDVHLGGRMFACSEVEGILVDGQKNYAQCLSRIDELYRASHKPTSGNDGASSQSSHSAGIGFASTNNLKLTKIENMEKNYQTVAMLCGVTELHASEEGVFLNAPLVDNLVANIQQSRQAYEAQVANAKADGQKALDAAKAEYEAKLANLQKQLDAKITEVDELKQKTSELSGTIETQTQTLTENEQTISDLRDQVTALANNPGESPAAGPSPSNNGNGVQAEGFVCEVPQYDSSLSPAENKKRMDEYNAKLAHNAYGG